MKQTILFESERLHFHSWEASDLPFLKEMNSDPRVMKYFPKTLEESENISLLKRLQTMYQERGLCYFKANLKSTGDTIGFIGLAFQDYESPYTPNVDIGWRLIPKHWNKGYATEGARAALDFGFNHLKLENIISVATQYNEASIHVMEKIGMKALGSFEHPGLKDFPHLGSCNCYQITLEEYVKIKSI